MKFIKYKQVARITLYGFDDLLRGSSNAIYTEPVNSEIFKLNIQNGLQVGKNAKRIRFQIKGLDNVKLSEHARFCMESINVPILIDGSVDSKVFGQTIVRMSNLSSINCFDSYGNGQSDPVIFTSQPHIQVVLDKDVDVTNNISTYTTPQVFYNPQPEILYNFPVSSNF